MKTPRSVTTHVTAANRKPSPAVSAGNGTASLTRRRFFELGAAGLALAPVLAGAAKPEGEVRVDERIRGLLIGGALGDALGGPIEFQPRDQIQKLADPPKIWRDDEVLDAGARAATGARLRLRSYADLRPGRDSYGEWNLLSPPGTITDDTRHKLVLLHALHVAEAKNRWPVTVKDLAQAYLDWQQTPEVVGREGYPELATDWLEEWQLAARWVLGERDLAKALPPERMWQGLPSCCGQMTLLPLAALFAGEPEKSYRAAFGLGFFDNGAGKDLNAALLAGLATALVTPLEAAHPRSAWEQILESMRKTDPLRFGRIRFTERQVDRWLNLARKLAREAEQRPARLFAAMEKQFEQNIKWEAQVPIVVVFACLELAGYDPLAALQLSQEWGNDSDTYAALMASFIGALHGPEVFPAAWRHAVIQRLQADHGVDLEEEGRFLARLRQKAATRELVAGI
jgi:ADP-ribosylglycohydrolase